MTALRRAIVVVALVGALVPVGAVPAWGCSCVPRTSDARAAERAAAVFTGVVSSGDQLTDQTVAWSFAVDSVYKGEVHEEQEIVTSQQSSACGFSFDEGRRYLIFA
ncbi:MAG TPA: hypothetical protein VFK89_07985, partial [Actinomycetota bacterium]|nr:hypothetical protein [Actinomycetota bacterium]